MPTIGLKTLETTVSKVHPTDRDILSKHFNELWEKYHSETEFYRTLKDNRQITLTQYRQVAIPKLRKVRDELQSLARVLAPKGGKL